MRPPDRSAAAARTAAIHGDMSRSAVPALAIFGALVLGAVLLAMTPAAQRWSGDVPLLEEQVRLILEGRLGDSQVLTWYPPLALIPLALPLMVGSGPTYAFGLAVEMAAVTAVGAALLTRLDRASGWRSRSVLLYGALVLAAGALVLWRYDIVPAVLVLGAIWGAATGRWATVGAALGLAAGLKIFAVILIPVFAAHAWRSGGTRGVGRLGLAVVVAGLVSLGAYLAFPGASPFELLAFTAGRPLQIETVPGSALTLLAALGISNVEVEFGSFSYNLVGPGADAVPGVLRLLQMPAVVGTLALGSLAVSRARRSRWGILVASVASALLALLVTNPVLSPQYLIWLLPLAPLLVGTMRWALVAAIGLTALLYPWLYSSLLELDPLPAALLVVRNGLLLVAWAASLLVLARIAWREHDRTADQRDGEGDRRAVVDPQIGDDGHARQDGRADPGQTTQR